MENQPCPPDRDNDSTPTPSDQSRLDCDDVSQLVTAIEHERAKRGLPVNPPPVAVDCKPHGMAGVLNQLEARLKVTPAPRPAADPATEEPPEKTAVPEISADDKASVPETRPEWEPGQLVYFGSDVPPPPAARPGENPDAVAARQNAYRRAQQVGHDKFPWHYAARSGAGALYEAAGKRYVSSRLENYQASTPEQAAVLAKLKLFVEDIGPNLEQGHGVVLFGPPGTGKDHLLVALGREALIDGFSVKFAYGIEFFRGLRALIGSDSGSEDEFMKPYEEVDVLILSDPLPPAGGLTDYQAGMLLGLVNRRYCERKSTWASMNVADGAEADSRLGAATVDRICHDALCLNCNWPSFRKPLGTTETRAGS